MPMKLNDKAITLNINKEVAKPNAETVVIDPQMLLLQRLITAVRGFVPPWILLER